MVNVRGDIKKLRIWASQFEMFSTRSPKLTDQTQGYGVVSQSMLRYIFSAPPPGQIDKFPTS